MMLSSTINNSFDHVLHAILWAVSCIPVMAITCMLVTTAFIDRKSVMQPKKRRSIVLASYKVGGLLGMLLAWPVYKILI